MNLCTADFMSDVLSYSDISYIIDMQTFAWRTERSSVIFALNDHAEAMFVSWWRGKTLMPPPVQPHPMAVYAVHPSAANDFYTTAVLAGAGVLRRVINLTEVVMDVTRRVEITTNVPGQPIPTLEQLGWRKVP